MLLSPAQQNLSIKCTAGPSDILEQNLEQILSLLWHLILQYQVGETTKTLMLDWIKATLPDKNISNFTTDWNNGINLSALVNCCKPGLIPNHATLDPSNAIENISNAMALAEEQLGIPKLMQPDDLAAESPDERSVMTYLSYFCGPASPGQEALLSWIQKQIPSQNVTNFTTDWVNGEALGMLVSVVSASAFPAYDQYNHTSKEDEVENCRTSMDAAEELLGIESTLEAEEFANPELNPLSRTTYLIQFYHAKLHPKVMDLHIPSKAGSGEMVWLDLVCPEESSETVQGLVNGSKVGNVPAETTTLAPNMYRITFEAKEEDTYSLAVFINENNIKGSPFHVDLTPYNVQLTNTTTPKKVGLPVSLIFNTSEAGRGEITAQAVGEITGHIPHQIRSTCTATYEVSFIPMKGDVYTLEVSFNERPIQGSPFVFPLESIAQPNNVKCSEPEFSEPHVAVRLNVDASNAGTGKLTAKCRGETSGEMDVEFTGSHDNPNGLTFTPTAEDVYTLSIYFDDTEVNGSPFFMDLRNIPPDASKVTILEQPSGNLNDGDQIKLCFDTSEAGTGTLTASCKGKKVGDIPLTVKEYPIHKHNVVFTPPEEDTYSISILWAENHIPGSPFSTTLIPKGKPDASKCRLVSPPIKSSLVNEEVSFEIDTAEAGRGSLNVTAVAREGTAAIPNIKPIPERPQVLKVGYIPATPGTHTLNLLWANEAIPSSPLKFKVTDIHVVPFGIPVLINMTANCRKGHLKAFAVHKEQDSQHDVPVKQMHKGQFHLTLKPKDEGLYRLHILHQDKEISGSPLAVSYSKAIRAANKAEGHIDFVVDDNDIRSGTKHSEPARKERRRGGKGAKGVMGLELDDEEFRVEVSRTFKLHCKDLGRGSPEVTCKPETGADISVTCVKGDKNSYLLEIEPKEAGKHELTVKFGGKHIVGSPFKIEFSPRSDASKCVLLDTPPECQKMSVSVDDVIFCISNKGAGKGKLMAVVKSCDTKETLPIFMTHPYSNHYHVEFNPSMGLDYTMIIKYDHVHIPGSPFKIALSDSTRVRMEGEGTIEAWLNEQNRFIVNEKKAGAAQLKVSIEGEGEELEPCITEVAEKVFQITYKPTKQGFYSISVKWGNLDIPGSPCRVKCRKRIFPEDLHITNPSGGAYVDKPLKLKLVAEGTEIEAGEEKRFTVLVNSSTSEEFPGTVERLDDGTCVCTIHPPHTCTVGPYKLHIKWMGEDIVGSSYDLEIAQQPQPHNFTVENVESECGGLAVQVHCPKFALRCGEMKASVEIEGTREQLPVTATQLSQEEYKVDFNPRKCGVYLLSILYDDDHIQGSPYRLVATDPSRCYAKGKGLKAAKVGEENTFTVCAENAGPGELTVDIQGDEGILEPLISAATESQYEVTYNPPKLGTYRISVQWDKQHLHGSPFVVLCVNAARYSVVNPPQRVYCGKPITVRVKAVNRKTPAWEALEILACSKNHTYKGEVQKDGSRNYICSVTPSEMGKYLIHVRCNGLNVIGSPFKTKVVAPPTPENIQAYGEGLADGIIGQEQFFIIQLSDTGYGHLGLQVKGPKKGFNINLGRPDKNNCIHAQYTPICAGDYMISVLWSGVHVPGSPFHVTIADPAHEE